MKNIGQMMKQAQQMQTRMMEMQQEIAKVEKTGQAGGGMVSVIINGKGEVMKLTIDKSIVDPNEVEMLEDLVVAALHDGKKKVDDHVAAETEKMMGGLNLPPGMKLPF